MNEQTTERGPIHDTTWDAGTGAPEPGAVTAMTSDEAIAIAARRAMQALAEESADPISPAAYLAAAEDLFAEARDEVEALEGLEREDLRNAAVLAWGAVLEAAVGALCALGSLPHLEQVPGDLERLG